MAERDTIQEEMRGLVADKFKPGVRVWARLFKKQTDIPAIIIETTPTQDGGMLCMLDLEIEDPFTSQITRQAHKKPVHSSQLLLRHAASPLGTSPSSREAEVERESDHTKETGRASTKAAKSSDLRARIAELEQENALLERYRPAMVEGAWRKLADADRTIRDLRYFIDQGERVLTRLTAHLAETESSNSESSHLKDQAERVRDHYQYILYGNTGEETAEHLTTERRPTQPVAKQAPRCSTVYSPTMCTDWHTPNTTDPGGYDIQGNYWCADCQASLELMNIAESLGYPEISHFPHNPEGMRAVMIQAGREQWKKRLRQIWNVDTIQEHVQLLLKKQEQTRRETTPT